MAKKPRKSEGWKRIGDKITDVDIHPQSKFDTKYVEIIAKLKSMGFTYQDIAYTLGVSTTAIQGWIKSYPEVKAALADGKENAIAKLVAKSIRLAAGYDYVEENEKYVVNKETGEQELKEVSKFKKHQAPNPKMLMFLLCNMDPDNWRSEHKIEVNHLDHVTVKLDGNIARKQIESLAGKLVDNTRKKVESHEVDRRPEGVSGDNTKDDS